MCAKIAQPIQACHPLAAAGNQVSTGFTDWLPSAGPRRRVCSWVYVHSMAERVAPVVVALAAVPVVVEAD